MPSREKLSEFTAWCAQHITGDEKGQAQIFLDRLLQAFDQAGSLDVGGTAEFRIRDEDGGGTAFADYAWKPVVLIEMKKRGTDLQKHYCQAFDYWMRLVPNRPRYVVLCNFDEFRVYDFDTDLDTPKDTLALKDFPERWSPRATDHPELGGMDIARAEISNGVNIGYRSTSAPSPKRRGSGINNCS